MPKPLAVLQGWLALAALAAPAWAKPAPRPEPAVAFYGLTLPAAACAPNAKPSPDAKLCSQRDEAACERLTLATLQQPDRTQDCPVWRALGKGFGAAEQVQGERLLRAVLGLVDRQVGGLADQGAVQVAQVQVRREVLRRFEPEPGSTLARRLRRDLAVLGLLAPVPERAACREAGDQVKAEKQPGIAGFMPSPLGALGPLVEPPWTRLAVAVTASGDAELRGECGGVLREVVVDSLGLGDWDGDGQDDLLVPTAKNQAWAKGFFAEWLAGKPWQVEAVEAAVTGLCPEKNADGLRCYRAAELGQWVVAQAPLAAEAERRQWGVIRALGVMAQREDELRALSEKNPKDPVAQAGVALARQARLRQVSAIERYLVAFDEAGPWFAKWKGEPAVVGGVPASLREARWMAALRSHELAQRRKAEGQFEEAFAEYGRAAGWYEKLFAQDPTRPDAYKLAWTLAECWYWAGVQCTAARGQDGELIVVEGQVAPTPADQVPVLRKSCDAMHKSVAWYDRVRDWKGPHSKDDRGNVMEKTEAAAFSSLDAAERVLSARASLPTDDPQYLDSLALPSTRPSRALDRADLEAAEGLKEVRRVTPKPLPAAAVEWLLEADAYVEMAATHTNPEDPRRAEKVSLKTAELLYKFRHFDPWPAGASKRTPAEFWSARLRFRRIWQRFPGSAAAREAVMDMLTSFGIEKDMVSLEAFTDELKDIRYEGSELDVIWERPLPEHPWQLSESTFRQSEQAVEAERLALARPDAAERFAVLTKARILFQHVGDEYAKMRDDTDRVDTKRIALGNAVKAYYRAQAWAKCYETLDLAEQILREALRDPKFTAAPTPLPKRPTKAQREQAQRAEERLRTERKALVDGLSEVLEIRADLRYKFFDLPATMRDFIALYENDPKGSKAGYYLQITARMAEYKGDLPEAVALSERIIKDFSLNSGQSKSVEDANWDLARLYRRAHDPKAELATLATFVLRYASDNSVSTRVFRALARTAELQATLGQPAAATATRRKLIDRYAAQPAPATPDSPETTLAAQAALDLLQPQVQAFLSAEPDTAQLPKLQLDLAVLMTAAQAVDRYGAPSIQAQTAALRSHLRRHLALQVRSAAPDLAAQLQADAVADLSDQLRAQPRDPDLRRELRYFQPDLTPPPGDGLLADYDPPGTLPLGIELPAPASDSAVAATFNQALLHYRQGHLPQAIAAATQAVKLDGNHSRSKVLLATLQLRAGDATAAVQTLDAGLAARPTDVMLLAEKIQVLAGLGKHVDAVQVGQTALRLDHSNPEVMWALGDAYRFAGLSGLAKAAYQRATEVYEEDVPRNGEPGPVVTQYDDRKVRSYGTLQGLDAEALPRDAGLAHVKLEFARLALLDSPPEAEFARYQLHKARDLRPNDAAIEANLGAALLILGDPAALAHLQKALDLQQNDPRLLNNLALAQRLSGQPDLARASLQQARRLDPRLPQPLYNLALLRSDTLRDAAGLAEIRELLSQFKQLRGPPPAGQADPADALLAEAEALVAWRAAVTR